MAMIKFPVIFYIFKNISLFKMKRIQVNENVDKWEKLTLLELCKFYT